VNFSINQKLNAEKFFPHVPPLSGVVSGAAKVVIDLGPNEDHVSIQKSPLGANRRSFRESGQYW
jgi:hypothetical protein